MEKVGKSYCVRHPGRKLIISIAMLGLMMSASVFAEEGVTDTGIRLGIVLDLEDGCNDW